MVSPKEAEATRAKSTGIEMNGVVESAENLIPNAPTEIISKSRL